MIKKLSLLFMTFFSFISVANAGICKYQVDNFIDDFQENLQETWDSDTYDVYVPVYAWHNRWTYDNEHLKKYNEEPWGIGFGKSRYDEDGDWHGLYAMAFKDSNFYLETIYGYAYLKNLDLTANGDFKGGLGFTLGLTQRHEYYYIPVPLPLPMAGISYKKLALQAAYVPGFNNDGNVLFTWLKFEF